jgi:hypothetical protein
MGLSIIALAAFSFGDLLRAADQADIFYYVLPFLLVFALVYAVLLKSTLLGANKGVNVIISVTLGLLSLVGNFFPNFLQQMAPNLAIALSILLAAIILIGLFATDSTMTWIPKVLTTIGIVAFIIVAYSSLSSYGFAGSWAWNQYAPGVITLVLIGVLVWWATK